MTAAKKLSTWLPLQDIQTIRTLAQMRDLHKRTKTDDRVYRDTTLYRWDECLKKSRTNVQMLVIHDCRAVGVIVTCTDMRPDKPADKNTPQTLQGTANVLPLLKIHAANTAAGQSPDTLKQAAHSGLCDVQTTHKRT